MDRSPSSPRRRQFLSGVATAAGLAGVSGCLQRSTSALGRSDPARVSLTIKTVPLDEDPTAIRIARHLADNLEAAGITSHVQPMRYQALLRDVLYNQEFELYIARYPGAREADFLRTLLHSRYAEEAGWQNPMGYANPELDELLDAQRRARGSRRRQLLSEIQHAVADDQPFTVIGFHDELGAFRTDRVDRGTAWRRSSPMDYLLIDRPTTTSEPSTSTSTDTTVTPTPTKPSVLRAALTDPRPTENLNPLAAEFRDAASVTGLLYDPLGRWRDGSVHPWLAQSWSWTESGDSTAQAELVLRDDLSWHDGRALTAADIAFTYRFLEDTSLGGQDDPIPTPRFRGRSSLVGDVTVLDATTVRVSFRTGSPSIAARAFTVPVLPEHVWQDRTAPASVVAINAPDAVTEALVWKNLEPVGSGPLAFEAVEPRQELVLKRNEEHFLHRDRLEDSASPYRFDFDRLRFVYVPSSSAGVELMADGEVDVVAAGIGGSTVPKIGRTKAVQLTVTPTTSFYHLGFNVRKRPLGDPRFRRAVAQLLDKRYLVDQVMNGYGEPAASPLARTDALAPQLRWDGGDPVVPFLGQDGNVNAERAQEAFRAAGYRYGNDGSLLLD